MNGKCQACEEYCDDLNDIMMCDECDGITQRNMIRMKAWDYVVEGAFANDKAREKLYQTVIKKYGRKEELYP